MPSSKALKSISSSPRPKQTWPPPRPTPNTLRPRPPATRTSLKSNAVTQQDTDNFTTQATSTTTQVKSAQANVARLEQLVGFENIYAPFDGIITARNVDIGTLINSGAGTSNSGELFHMVAENVLRIYVNVPQALLVLHCSRSRRPAHPHREAGQQLRG